MATNKQSFLSPSGWRDYLVQVSLIIISLLIAVGVDRCNQHLQSKSSAIRDYCFAAEVPSRFGV